MNRRDFLLLATAAGIAPAAVARPVAQASAPALISTWGALPSADESYFAGRVAGARAPLALPSRGHGVVADPQRAGIAYLCARRPGTWLWRVDLARGAVLAQARADDGFRFEGHAIVDAPRGLVYATESEQEHGRAQIGVYDADTLDKRGCWPTGGLGAHELLWLDESRFAVAHGGILTLPETGRVKRNLDRMEPSLVVIDAASGVPVATHRLPDPTMGIRHLARAADGLLGVALQNEGPAPRPLFALFDGATLALARVDAAGAQRHAGYGASVAVTDGVFAVTCTKGHCVVLFDRDGHVQSEVACRSPAGLAAVAGRFHVSNEHGELIVIAAATGAIVARTQRATRRWDNHLAFDGSPLP